MESIDRRIVNHLQGGLPVSERPYADVAQNLGIAEGELIRRLKALLDQGLLSRFGPMYNAERFGGGLTLAAMEVAPEDVPWVAEQVNAFPEVAHNYLRDHVLNMWFVLATEAPERIPQVLDEIEQATGIAVYNMPKIDEFYIGLKFEV